MAQILDLSTKLTEGQYAGETLQTVLGKDLGYVQVQTRLGNIILRDSAKRTLVALTQARLKQKKVAIETKDAQVEDKNPTVNTPIIPTAEQTGTEGNEGGSGSGLETDDSGSADDELNKILEQAETKEGVQVDEIKTEENGDLTIKKDGIEFTAPADATAGSEKSEGAETEEVKTDAVDENEKTEEAVHSGTMEETKTEEVETNEVETNSEETKEEVKTETAPEVKEEEAQKAPETKTAEAPRATKGAKRGKGGQ